MSEKNPNSRIIGLKVRNVKRLSAVDFTPDPEQAVIGIGGKNASGKTSLLDAIMYALAGSKHIGDDPVRHGAKKGEIEVELDDYIIKRVITNKGQTLTIKGRNGQNYGSPQKLLDEMTGKLTFDPLKFQRLSETTAGRREQAEIFKQLVGLDFSAKDRLRKDIFDGRSEINRDLKRVTAQLESMPSYQGVPDEEISVARLSDDLQEALKQNQENEQEENELVSQTARIQELEQQIEVLQGELASRRIVLAEQQGIVNALKYINETELREQINQADETNQKIRTNLDRKSLLAEQDELQKQADSATAQLQNIDEEKAAALSKANVPVEGLESTDDGVTYKGVPFEGCSSAEQLKLSVAMGIAMNPKPRIMLIRNGSLLDSDSRKTLRDMSEHADLQCWVEFVNSDEECAIVIEDGMVQ